MRELKFRAYDSTNKEMWYPVKAGINGLRSCDILERFENVMQFTGLKDKNGKEIYEGDIIETEHEAEGIVIWDKLAAKFAFDCDEPMWPHPIHSMGGEKEIIGNIFENKELLK